MTTTAETVRVGRKELEQFCAAVFEKQGLGAQESSQAASVLVAADVRGIPSHGIGRLWRYVNGLKSGLMVHDAVPETLMDTSSSLVVNAKGGMGAPVSVGVMKSLIEKARGNGSAFGCVRNSNHFGIAGYYAMMALEADMLGIAMTNTAALGVPTFGRQVMFGTNPLAFAAPAQKEGAFVLDMSTTVVTRGKIEVYDRHEKPLPEGWAVDKTGRSARNARSLLDDMQERIGGGILPLGGLGESHGGYKGYGLAVMIDVLCSVLCGAPFGEDVFDTAESSARVSHFFGAIKIEAFREPAEFRHDMDRMLESLRKCPPAEDAERVYFAGQKEQEHEQETEQTGVPVLGKTWNMCVDIGREANVPIPPLL